MDKIEKNVVSARTENLLILYKTKLTTIASNCYSCAPKRSEPWLLLNFIKVSEFDLKATLYH